MCVEGRRKEEEGRKEEDGRKEEVCVSKGGMRVCGREPREMALCARARVCVRASERVSERERERHAL